MRKQSNVADKNWQELTLKYREWEDLMAKGRLRMKKKVKKDGKEYYDFDFSRYQYYYSFPDDHIALAPPAFQKKFINSIVEQNCEDFSQLYVDCDLSNWSEVENLLRPLQLHEALTSMKAQFHEKINMLRIEKSLTIKKMQGLYGSQNQIEKGVVDLIDSEIRSYIHKLIKVEDNHQMFGSPLATRLKGVKSNLKTRQFDEFQFTTLSKSDIIVYCRLRQNKLSMQFNSLVLSELISNLYAFRRSPIASKAKEETAQKIMRKRQALASWKIRAGDQIRQILLDKDSYFFENETNRTMFEEVIQSLDYISCFERNLNKVHQKGHLSQHFTNCTLNYDEVEYLPFNGAQVKARLGSKCERYFPDGQFMDDILSSTDEHICYKINSLAFLQLKVLWETYDPSYYLEESSLIKIKAVMQKELELVFSHNWSRLTDMREHSIKVVTAEKWEPGFLYEHTPVSEKEAIMWGVMREKGRYQDPQVCSFMALLAVVEEKVAREAIKKLTLLSIEKNENILKYRALYYRNCCMDEKSHLVNIINHCIRIELGEDKTLRDQFFTMLQINEAKERINPDILQAYYMLCYLRCVEKRYELLELLNGQVMCMVKAQNRIRLIWRKSRIPFEMSPQFMTRFTEGDKLDDPYDFLNWETLDARNEDLFKDMANDEASRDCLFWKSNGRVEVRRRKSDNPLLEGKSMIYQGSYQHLEQALRRVEFLCSESIKSRQEFLVSGQFTGIVDRVELVFEFLSQEEKLQRAKLKMMEAYCDLLINSVSPKAIKSSYESMNKIFHSNNVVDLTQPHFSQCYIHETQVLERKAHVLSVLATKQKEVQERLIQRQAGQRKNFNFNNSIPEMSSLYYSEEIAAQDNSIIEEAVEDNSIPDDGSSEVGSSILQTNRLQNQSDMSSLLDGGSQYHLKMTFQEILSKNSIQDIESENNKKEELMNRKRQKLINDTTLGTLLPRREKQNLYYYLDSIHSVMDSIDTIHSKHALDPHFMSLLMDQVLQLVSEYEFVEYGGDLKPDLLPLALNASGRILSKLMDKLKTSGAASGTQNQHWEEMPSQIIDKLISSQSGEEVDQMRGLYVALNYLHSNEIDYRLKRIQKTQEHKFGSTNLLLGLIRRYSASQDEHEAIIKRGMATIEQRQSCQCKILNLLKENGQMPHVSIGNYHHYYKISAALDVANCDFIQSCAERLLREVDVLEDIRCELNLMEKYRCCTHLFYENLSKVPQIDNRVVLRKRIDYLKTQERLFFPKELVEDLLKVFIKNPAVNDLSRFQKAKGRGLLSSLSELSNNSSNFESYLHGMVRLTILMNFYNQEIRHQARQGEENQKITSYLNMLPYLSKHLYVPPANMRAISFVFEDAVGYLTERTLNKTNMSNVHVALPEEKLQFMALLKTNAYSHLKEDLINWMRNIFNRKCNESKMERHSWHEAKCMQRHSYQTVNDVHKRINDDTLEVALHKTFKNIRQCTHTIKLRQWIETQLIIFGCTLKEDELIKFRKMLCNPTHVFPIFWENSVHHVISTKDLSRMKTSLVDQNEILERYRIEYLNYNHLKKVYRNFVEDLSEFDLNEETTDLFLVLFSSRPDYFERKQNDWAFLFSYGDSIPKSTQNSIDHFLSGLAASNPARAAPFSINRVESYDAKPKSLYNLSALKWNLWSAGNKNKTRQYDSSRRFLKSRLNDVKSRATKPITTQIMLSYYKKERLIKILTDLNVDYITQRAFFGDEKDMFERMIHEGHVVLNSSERYLYNLTEKDTSSRGEFLKLKDEVILTVQHNQLYQKLIRQKFFQMSLATLTDEINLQQILTENMHVEANFRDAKILKSTINKILVPKVKLNPFLESPLKIDNYFIAGTIKLSYIDQFLNKLRNRAVLIELAEGGFGYLLKVNELDESVESLCKAIIGFSQKEYADRLRTFYETFEDVKEKHEKLRAENKQLKTTLQVVKDFQGKQLKYLIYEKLNESMVYYYEHEKNYDILANLYKNLDSKLAKEYNNKYEQKIIDLQKENSLLKSKFIDFEKQLKKNASSQIHEVKDKLFATFKDSTEEILHKKFISDEPLEPSYEKIQQNDSQILLKKLRMQKIFYEMKWSKMEAHLQEKIKALEAKVIEQSKLQNLLLIQQEKNRILVQEMTELQKCSIQNEYIKKQMQKKDEQETLQKFRLVKVNETLKGKINRMETQMTEDNTHWLRRVDEMGQIAAKSKSSFSVQVSTDKKPRLGDKRKSFHIRTQTSGESNKAHDFTLWKDKWLKSEKRSQEMIESLKKLNEHFIFTKNGSRLSAGITELISSCQDRRRLVI